MPVSEQTRYTNASTIMQVWSKSATIGEIMLAMHSVTSKNLTGVLVLEVVLT
jgi:hypothetical protein